MLSQRSGTRPGRATLVVDSLTGSCARNQGSTNPVGEGPRPGPQTGRFPARLGHRPGAISVGPLRMIAIPFAANPGRVAAIAGQTASPRCNQSGHEPPMIAILATGYCGSLQLRRCGPGSTATTARGHTQRSPARLRSPGSPGTTSLETTAGRAPAVYRGTGLPPICRRAPRMPSAR